MGNSIYILHHYTAWVILSGDSTQIARQSLSKVNLKNYQAIVSFVNINKVHWKLLYINAVNHTVYLVDPSKSYSEKADSIHAAKKFSEYLDTRKTCHGKTEWGNIKWKGGVLKHPFQRDASSCGVIVILMAKEIMRAFPAVLVVKFGTSKKEVAQERKTMALQILKESVFDEANNCAMCSLKKPSGSGPPMTNWIQCDTCERWYHEECLGMTEGELEHAKVNNWDCILCS
ncbi:hypothetical protein R3I93_019961 [Phoxinus phoxinus]|uniref:PHD-type domain-containing protein n=1 Tax=Phoxinus phoxinus TaxID=58324 RepID=A0AAN9CDP8_9TELE